MAYALDPFATIPLDESLLDWLIRNHQTVTLPRLRRLWNYYRNALADPTSNGSPSGAPHQSIGLPPRLATPTAGTIPTDEPLQREIVIENDIAWRIHTLVDFMFPEAPRLVSQATDPDRRETIEAVVNAIIESSGGIALWQNAALLGSVYGHVDFLLVPMQPGRAIRVPSNPSLQRLADIASPLLRIETVEAPRAIPLLSQTDYRTLDAYILHHDQPTNAIEREPFLRRLTRAFSNEPRSGGRGAITITEIISSSRIQRYENETLVDERINRLGRIPVIHIQNLSQPLRYEGLSDVEPLIPLQDELNTRLSDRANRVTMQSFQMWLGKGVDDFTDHPVGPGQMWFTDNLDASIEAFGGDMDSPSERAHIEELREALDKTSGVTPASAGHIKARVGNLTSENALRISLMGTIAKTKRKRITYAQGIVELAELILHALDVMDVLHTSPAERAVDVVWADALPVDESRRIADALAKAQLGIPQSTLRAELGYPDEVMPNAP